MLKTVMMAATLTVSSPVLALDAPKALQPGPPVPEAGDPGTRSTTNAVPVAGTSQALAFLDRQPDDAALASALLAATVYDAADQKLGSVKDLIIADGGSIAAVVMGVGGFLGVGEKIVAVPIGSLTQTADADGHVKLVLHVTRDALRAAPSFLTLAELHRQQMEATQPPPGPAGIASPAN